MRTSQEFVQMCSANKEATKELLLKGDIVGAMKAFYKFDELLNPSIYEQIQAYCKFNSDPILSSLKPREYSDYAQSMMYKNVQIEVARNMNMGWNALDKDDRFVTIGLLFILCMVKSPKICFYPNITTFNPDNNPKFDPKEYPFILGYLKMLESNPHKVEDLRDMVKGMDNQLSSLITLTCALNEYKQSRPAMGHEAKAEAKSVNPSLFKLIIQSLINWVKDLIQAIKDKLIPSSMKTQNQSPEFDEILYPESSILKPRP